MDSAGIEPRFVGLGMWGTFFECPQNKDSILGSILGFPDFRKLPIDRQIDR